MKLFRYLGFAGIAAMLLSASAQADSNNVAAPSYKYHKQQPRHSDHHQAQHHAYQLRLRDNRYVLSNDHFRKPYGPPSQRFQNPHNRRYGAGHDNRSRWDLGRRSTLPPKVIVVQPRAGWKDDHNARRFPENRRTNPRRHDSRR